MRVQVITPIQGEQLDLFPGDIIITRSGEATVTRTMAAGREQIIFADYGSGIEQPHIQEGLLSPEQLESKPKRHSLKGAASGWIEERIGNKKRKNPTTSYYYCWQGNGQRMKVYIKARLMWRCHQMVETRCSVDEILRFLNG